MWLKEMNSAGILDTYNSFGDNSIIYVLLYHHIKQVAGIQLSKTPLILIYNYNRNVQR
jgi:hypothetical protein